jgi:ATP synthase protein I
VGTEDPVSPPSPSPQKQRDSDNRQFAMALELPIVLVSAIVVGGLFGYLLDRWLHTKPILMLVLGGVGFYAGVRDVLRRMARDQ